MLYYKRCLFWLELYVSNNWCVITQNTHGSYLLSCHFVHTFGHNYMYKL